jgi:16S rRNA (cytosine1407-C5)-methyltransferase
MASILKMPKGVVNNLFKLRTVTTIRLNPLAEEPEKILQKLRKQGFNLERVKWVDNTYIVLNKDKSEIGKLPEYFEGLYYIQNLSSMIPPQVLQPKSHEKVLDMCAAPGSKTTQLAAMMNNEGKIIANDVDAWRVGKLKNVLEIFKVTNTEVRNEEANVYAQEQEQYDKILLDAPCSGEGMIYIAKPMALRFWNVKKAKGFSKLQEQLITSAFKALKKGGTMIYSTCTLEPDENEGVITHLLKTHKNAVVEEIPMFMSTDFATDKKNVKRGILTWNGKEYSKEVSKTYRVIPSERMMGFYIAQIKKS